MTNVERRVWRRKAGIIVVAVFVGSLAITAREQGAPTQPPAAPAQGPGAGRAGGPGAGAPAGGGGRGPAEPQPDFSPKPPVRGVSVEEQQKRFVLHPGFQIAPVLTDPTV